MHALFRFQTTIVLKCPWRLSSSTTMLPSASQTTRMKRTGSRRRSPRCVLMSLEDGLTVMSMERQFVADNKAEYKRLAGGVAFIDVIPKNPSGKLLRRVLRDRAREMKAKAKAKL